MIERAFLVGIVAMMAFSIGCGAAPYDTAQRFIIGFGEGVDTLDRIVAPMVEEGTEDALSEARRRHNEATTEAEQCREDCQEIPDPLDVYRELRQPWADLTTALSALADVLTVGETAVDLWRDIESDDPPQEFQQFCQDLGPSIDRVLFLLERLSIEIPEAFDVVLPHVTGVCSVLLSS